MKRMRGSHWSLFLMPLLWIAAAACHSKEYAETAVDGAHRASEVARQASARADTSAAEDDLGIPECDSYLRDVRACINEKMPGSEQPAPRAQVDAQDRKWRQMALDETQKASLPEECKAARDLAAASFSSYGCSL